MDKFYKKLMNLSKSNISIQNKMKDRMYDKQLMNQVKEIIDQTKVDAKTNIDNHVNKMKESMQDKQLLNQVRALIDQKKIDAKSNIENKVTRASAWMEEFTGLDKVRAAQNEVFQHQDEFTRSQNKRRELGVKLTSLQMELNDLHNDILMTSRSDEKYLHLITREHKVIKLEQQLRNEFNQAEGEERENFTRFTTKIKESQDKEREQALRTKYWTLFVSVGVTLIGVLGNGVISFLKMHKIDETIVQLGQETQTLSQNIHSDVSKLDQNQRLMLQLLTQDQSSGTKNNSIDNQTNLDPLQQTLKRLMLFTTQNTAKTEGQLTSLNANQAAVMNVLKEISKELERLNVTQKEMRHEFLLVEKKRSDQFLFRNSGTIGDSQSRSGTTSDSQSRNSSVTSSSSLGAISNSIYDKASSLGSGVKEAIGNGYSRAIEDYRISGESVKTLSNESDSSSGSSSWTKPLVYFGIFSVVYVLATSGVFF
uniref:Coiled-coil domain-containing protein 51 n=2 Tax=Cacopsylla melanoneura TaxID=428564 RepID=A0A8D8YNB9_9HEMI